MSQGDADFGTWVKTLRKQHKLTQGGLAKEIGYSIWIISKIEQNRSDYQPSEEVIRLLAGRLGVSGEEYPRFLALGRSQSSSDTTVGVVENLVQEGLAGAGNAAPSEARNWAAIWFLALGAALVLLPIAVMVLMPRPRLADEATVLMLVGPKDGRVRVETADGLVLSGGTIQVNEPITVTFTIRNYDHHEVTVRRLVAGARGPGAKLEGWDAPIIPFVPAFNIRLKPGESYEYRERQSFPDPGDYFVEPVFQDARGDWLGIRPFTPFEFEVVE